MNKLPTILILILLTLSSCTTNVLEPTPPPEPPITSIEKPVVTELMPSSILLNNKSYSLNDGKVCLNTIEAYNNVKSYFQLSVANLFKELLIGLGYDVVINPRATDECELIVDLTFEIELLSARYENKLAPSGSTGDCYTGIDINGQLAITLSGKNEHEIYYFGHEHAPHQQIDLLQNECYDIEDNPLVAQWIANYENFEVDNDYFITMLKKLWGTRASIALLGIKGNLEGLDTLQDQASHLVWKNKITSDDVDYYARVVEKNPSERERFLNLLPQNSESETLIPILLILLNNEDQESLVIQEINLLQKVQPNEKYANAASPIIFELVSSYYGDGWQADEKENFIRPAVDVLASLGPDVIPHAIWYLSHQKEEDPETVFLAVWVLNQLENNGYSDQVAQQAGSYLSYAYFLMDNGEFDYPGNIHSNAIPNLLADLFPDVVNGEGYYTKPIKFYRAWEKSYGEE